MKDHQLHGHIGVQMDGIKIRTTWMSDDGRWVVPLSANTGQQPTNKGDIWQEEMAGQLM